MMHYLRIIQVQKLNYIINLTLFNEHGEAGILTEKDPGEKSYYDFISFHLLLKKMVHLEKVVFGDYIF